MIDASPLLVKKIYMDYAHWNQLFPLTIKATSFVKEENGKLTVMADHKTAGMVINIITVHPDEEVKLEEFKPK